MISHDYTGTHIASFRLLVSVNSFICESIETIQNIEIIHNNSGHFFSRMIFSVFLSPFVYRVHGFIFFIDIKKERTILTAFSIQLIDLMTLLLLRNCRAWNGFQEAPAMNETIAWSSSTNRSMIRFFFRHSFIHFNLMHTIFG